MKWGKKMLEIADAGESVGRKPIADVARSGAEPRAAGVGSRGSSGDGVDAAAAAAVAAAAERVRLSADPGCCSGSTTTDGQFQRQPNGTESVG